MHDREEAQRERDAPTTRTFWEVILNRTPELPFRSAAVQAKVDRSGGVRPNPDSARQKEIYRWGRWGAAVLTQASR